MADRKLIGDLLDEISRFPIIDCHTHIRWYQPSAENLADIIFYHYIATELESAGMPRELISEELPPEKRIQNILPYFPRIQNTTTVWGLMQIFKELFDFDGVILDESNWKRVYDIANQRLKEEGWYRKVLKEKLNIQRAFLTIEFDEEFSGYDREMFIPTLRIDPWINQIHFLETTRRLEKASGISISCLGDLKEAIGRVYGKFKDQGAVSVAISLPPDFTAWPVAEVTAEKIYDDVLSGKPISDGELLSLRSYLFYTLVEFCKEFSMPFQLMLGVDRRVFKDRDALSTDLNMIKTLRDVLNRYPDVRFDICILNTILLHELTVYAKIFPNCVVSGHWWYTFYPVYIKQMLRERIEMLPIVKTNGFFSDSYYCEWSVAKVRLYLRQLAEVLAEKIEDGYLTEDQALWVARRLLWENPIENFTLDLG